MEKLLQAVEGEIVTQGVRPLMPTLPVLAVVTRLRSYRSRKEGGSVITGSGNV